MATGVRYYTPNSFDVDPSGVPYVGGQLFFYATNTSTPLDTYSDVGLTTPNTNPVVADSTGHFGNIFLTTSTAYKVAAYGPNLTNPTVPSTPAAPQGTQLWTADPCGPAAGGANSNAAGIIGEVRAFAGLAALIPAQWYLCYGQAVSRTTYASAFAVLGTAWGVGDGSTTFNLPDLRGRTLAGLDNMGGSSASRITTGVCGVPGTTLGGVGGSQLSQQDTLTATSTVTDPTHVHNISLNISGHTSPGGAGTPGASTAGYGTDAASTGITVATTVVSNLTGTTQNIQPTAMINSIIFLGA